jgi:hypothetical protein
MSKRMDYHFNFKSVLKERIQLTFPKNKLLKNIPFRWKTGFLATNGHFKIMSVKKMEERFSKLRPIISGKNCRTRVVDEKEK